MAEQNAPEWLAEAENEIPADLLDVDQSEEYVEESDIEDDRSGLEVTDEQPENSNIILKDVVLRRATPLDASTIAKFLKKARPKHYGSLFGEENDLKGMQRLIEMSSQHLLMVAERSGTVLGVMGVWIIEWEWGNQIQFDTEFLVVLPSWERRGLGLKLIEHVEDLADTYSVNLNLCVHSRIKPEPKSKWFERRGYQYVGSAYVRPPKDGQKQTNTDNEFEVDAESE